MSSLSNGFEFRPPVGILDWEKSLPTIFHNQFVSDFLIPFFKTKQGGYMCNINEKFLNQYSSIINVTSNNN